MLRDLDTGLIVAAGITPANAPEASVTGGIAADLDAAGRHLAELTAGPACWAGTSLSSTRARARSPA